eukprot:m.81874 g.81874  ORF g.81874 m.81874 type:complete len:1204 (-) comp12833_c0_seq2:1375-4986(-)
MNIPDEFVDQAFSPVVVLQVSDDAEAVCAKSNLTFAELLAPFARFQDKKPQYPKVFSIRFKTLSQVQRPSVREAQTLTTNAVASRNVEFPDPSGDIIVPVETPWFDAYRKAFLGLVPASDHEFFNHPVACVSVVSTQNTNPINSLKTSFDAGKPPKEFIDEGLDANVYRYYVLLQDGTDPETDKNADTILADMQANFGMTNTHKLVINTHKGEKPKDDGMAALWENFLPPPVAQRGDSMESLSSRRADSATPDSEKSQAVPNTPPNSDGTDLTIENPLASSPTITNTENNDVLGKHISPDDLQGIRNFVSAFGVDGLIPYLESLARQLEKHVAQTKKSMVSRAGQFLKGFTSNNKNTQLEENSAFVGLSHRDAMRRLGDIMFTLQDYEAAHNTYNNVKKDEKDKAWKHFAGAQEMLGISLFMQDPTKVDHRYFNVAISAYLKCNATLYACRAMLIVAQMLVARSQFREASKFFMMMTSEESDLRSALLFEQASMCYLKIKPSCQRRAAFHLVLAGHRFTKAVQRRHALRCYLQARQVYNGRGWQLAEDHVNFTIGRQAYLLGHKSESLDAFRRLLTDSQQYAKQQNLYIKEFVQAWRQVHGDKEEYEAELPVPVVNDDSLILQLRSEAPIISAVGHWRKLESTLLQIAQPGRPRVSSVSSLTRDTDNSTKPVCVAGEHLQLKCDLFNPLHVPLELRGVQLIANMSDDSITPPETEVIEVFKIPPKETKEIVLEATPQNAGQLVIKGIACSIGGTVMGCKNFLAKGKRLNKIKSHFQSVVYGPDLRLTPIVIPPMPLLTGVISGLDKPVAAGELVEASLDLTNNSNAPLLNLYVACSRPEDVIYRDDMEACHKKGISPVHVYKPKEGSALGAGCTVKIPVQVQFSEDEAGELSLMFMMCYQASKAHPSLPYRVLRLTADVNVLPSVSIETSIHKIPQVLDEMILRITATATQAAKSTLDLRSLMIANSAWTGSLEGAQQKERFSLKAGESLSFFCRLHRNSEEKKDSEHCMVPLSQTMNETLTGGEKEFFHRGTANAERNDIKVLMFWGMEVAEKNEIRVGQTCDVAKSAQSSSISDEIEIAISHCKRVHHDFDSEPLLKIPVTARVLNCFNKKIDVEVNWLGVSEEEKSGTNNISWGGKTKVKMHLGPSQTASIDIVALATESGVYDLNRVVTAVFSDTGVIRKVSKEPSYVQVFNRLSESAA